MLNMSVRIRLDVVILRMVQLSIQINKMWKIFEPVAKKKKIRALSIRLKIITLKIWLKINTLTIWLKISTLTIWLKISTLTIWLKISTLTIWLKICTLTIWLKICTLTIRLKISTLMKYENMENILNVCLNFELFLATRLTNLRNWKKYFASCC
jgi:hypothetical protein